MNNKNFQRFFVIGSGLAFLALMTLPMLDVNNRPSSEPSANPTSTATSSQQEQLQKIAQGYEQVLQREPNNPNALQGLIEARLQMNDLQGAIPPMEKLVSLYPQETKLKEILSVIKKQADLQKTQPPQPPAANPQKTK